jgi:hypothetical protein
MHRGNLVSIAAGEVFARLAKRSLAVFNDVAVLFVSVELKVPGGDERNGSDENC